MKAIAVFDRAESFGAHGGPLFLELRSALYDLKRPPKAVSYIYGLGGRDLKIKHIKDAFMDLKQIKKTGKIKKLANHPTVRN